MWNNEDYYNKPDNNGNKFSLNNMVFYYFFRHEPEVFFLILYMSFQDDIAHQIYTKTYIKNFDANIAHKNTSNIDSYEVFLDQKVLN